MRLVESTRRFGQIQHARELIIKELERPDIPQDQRTALLHDLTQLQLDISKKWKRHAETRKERANKNKGGRPKRMFDRDGNPLYNNSPKLESPTSKQKFLEGIKTDESADSGEIEESEQ